MRVWGKASYVGQDANSGLGMLREHVMIQGPVVVYDQVLVNDQVI